MLGPVPANIRANTIRPAALGCVSRQCGDGAELLLHDALLEAEEQQFNGNSAGLGALRF